MLSRVSAVVLSIVGHGLWLQRVFEHCAHRPNRHISCCSPAMRILAENDFFAVVDVRPGSADGGKVIATTSIGMKMAMPHHMEYSLPPAGELLFANAHHHEKSFLLDVSNPRSPRIVKYVRSAAAVPISARLLPDADRHAPGRIPSQRRRRVPIRARRSTPGNHGGIAGYSADGRSAAHGVGRGVGNGESRCGLTPSRSARTSTVWS